MPFEPTVSNALFKAIGFVVTVLVLPSKFFWISITSLGFEMDYSSILTLDLRDIAGEGYLLR